MEPLQFTRTKSKKLYPTPYMIWWRESIMLRPHTRSSGLPAGQLKLPKPLYISRTSESTYARFQLIDELNEKGERRTLSWRLSDWRSDVISVTRENNCDLRASRDAMAPVVVAMLEFWTQT